MIKYNKIIALIIISSILNNEIVISRPSRNQRSSGSGNKQIGGAGGMQKTGLQDNSGKKGALAIRSQNNQQGPTGDHTTAGKAALARRNTMIPMNETEASEQTAEEPITVQPVIQEQEQPVMIDQNNDEIPDSPAVINPASSVQDMVASVTVEKNSTHQTVYKQPQESHAVIESSETSSEDILKKLKTLETIETKTDTLLKNSSVDLLFNNFVYLKEFITKNFDKDTMLNLCRELINQIYPAEKEVIQIAPPKEKDSESSGTTTQDQPSQEDNTQEDSPSLAAETDDTASSDQEQTESTSQESDQSEDFQ